MREDCASSIGCGGEKIEGGSWYCVDPRREAVDVAAVVSWAVGWCREPRRDEVEFVEGREPRRDGAVEGVSVSVVVVAVG